MLLIVLGLIGLWFGTKWIINGAIGIAYKFDLSHSFVGIAILGVATDLPEVFVTLKASMLHLQGIESSGIMTGNAIGSSISQITFVLGTAGLFLKFIITKKDLIRDGIALFSSLILLFIFGFDGIINRLEGGILLLVYILYYIVLLKSKKGHTDDNSSGKQLTIFAMVFFLLGGFAILIYSSNLVVENAMLLATKWGVAQSFVGILIIGLGTSLPELAVTIGAAVRKSAGMSVGNIIGSNIFDGFVPIGLGGLISTTNMERNLLLFDLPVLFVVTLVALVLMKTKKGISVAEGITLILFYLIYIGIKLFYFEGKQLFH